VPGDERQRIHGDANCPVHCTGANEPIERTGETGHRIVGLDRKRRGYLGPADPEQKVGCDLIRRGLKPGQVDSLCSETSLEMLQRLFPGVGTLGPHPRLIGVIHSLFGTGTRLRLGKVISQLGGMVPRLATVSRLQGFPDPGVEPHSPAGGEPFP